LQSCVELCAKGALLEALVYPSRSACVTTGFGTDSDHPNLTSNLAHHFLQAGAIASASCAPGGRNGGTVWPPSGPARVAVVSRPGATSASTRKQRANSDFAQALTNRPRAKTSWKGHSPNDTNRNSTVTRHSPPFIRSDFGPQTCPAKWHCIPAIGRLGKGRRAWQRPNL